MKTMTYLKIFLALVSSLLAVMIVGQAASSSSATVYLPLVLKDSSPQPSTATTIQLIEQDLAAGKLDAMTAAIYEVYSLIPDSPLPLQYVGVPDPKVDIVPFQALASVYTSLSTAQKTEIDPYLRRPDDQTSAYFQFQQRQQAAAESTSGSMASSTRPPSTIQWDTLMSTTGVKIHYRMDIDGDEAKAVGLAAAIDAKIYNSLNNLMGRVWMDDTGCVGGGVEDDGGGSALDIYLLHGIGDDGIEISCHASPTPGWVIVNADRPLGNDTTIGMVQDATHEMFHAIQDSYYYFQSVGSYLWVQEATAMWSEDYVYPNAQSEHDYANLYLNKTTQNPLDDNKGTQRYYGEYLWPFYMYRVQNSDPSFVRTMFENAKYYPSKDIFMLNPTSDDPVTLFPDFAVKNWNQAPLNNYQKVDKLTQGVTADYKQTISGVAEKRGYALSGPDGQHFDRLSASYYDFVFTDSTARTVAFYNGVTSKLSERLGLINANDAKSIFYQTDPLDFSQYKGMNVQALMKVNNTWTQEDWSDYGSKVLCRDRKAQNLQELVLIVTNSNFKSSQANYSFKPVNRDTILEVSPNACYQWKGTFDVADTSDPGVTNTLTGNVTFEASDTLYGPEVDFYMKSGSAYLTLNGTTYDGVYKYNVGGWADFSSSDPDSYLTTYNLVTGGPYPNAYYGNGSSNALVTGTMETCCNEDGSYEVNNAATFAIGRYFVALSPIWTDQLNSQAPGNVIAGSYTDPDNHITWQWHFTAQTEP